MAFPTTRERFPQAEMKHGMKQHFSTHRKMHKSICTPISTTVIESLDPKFVQEVRNNPLSVDTFLKSLTQGAMTLPEIRTNVKKTCQFNIVKKKNNSVKQPRKTKRRLTKKEKHELGLKTINKSSLKFLDFIPLHNMWKDYMKTFLNIEELEENGFTGSHLDKQWKMVSVQLIKADYQGAIMRVVRSICTTLVGISGIMIFENKNTFQILGRDDVLRVVPKKITVFEFEVDNYVFTIFGRDMCVRPAQRGVKKVKKKLIADL